MSTNTKDMVVLSVVAEKLATVGFANTVAKPLQVVEGRLYMEVTTGLAGYIMVDPPTQRVKFVYNTSGEPERNFSCTDEQLDLLLELLETQ